mgnify:FL=1
MSALFSKSEIRQPSKFWTAIDGTVGTAHRGRDGSLKDFRPAVVSRETVYQNRFDVTFHAPRGVTVEPLQWTAYYRVVDVEYRPGAQARVVGQYDRLESWSPTARAIPEEIVPQVMENFTWGEAEGFPYPSWKREETEREALRIQKVKEELNSLYVGKEEFMAWAAALPKGSKEYRWLRRYAVLCKARQQVYAAVKDAFPGRFAPRMDQIREWLTQG